MPSGATGELIGVILQRALQWPDQHVTCPVIRRCGQCIADNNDQPRHVIEPIQTGQLFRREWRFRCDGPALNTPRRQLERLVPNGASDMACGHGADQPGCQGVNRCLFTLHPKEVIPQGQARTNPVDEFRRINMP